MNNSNNSKNEKDSKFLFLLIVILFIQIYFFFLVFLKKETNFSLEIFIASAGMLISVVGWWATYFFGFRKLKKEIGIKEKLEIYREMTSQLVNNLFGSYYQVNSLLKNEFNLENCSIQKTDDIYKNILQDNLNKLIDVQSDFWNNFQKTYEIFQAWKPLFSEKIDYESKFLLGTGWSFYKKISKYKELLQNYVILNYGKNNDQLKKEKDGIIELEKIIDKNSVVLINALQKFVLDMSREVFTGFYDNKDESRLFSLELENLESGMKIETLTENGIEDLKYVKTDFQEKFGSLLEK